MVYTSKGKWVDERTTNLVNCYNKFEFYISYLVLDQNGSPLTKWWNSEENEAAYIDFTKQAAVDWYVGRLKALQVSAGIDSYKFDAGESSWSPPVNCYLC